MDIHIGKLMLATALAVIAGYLVNSVFGGAGMGFATVLAIFIYKVLEEN